MFQNHIDFLTFLKVTLRMWKYRITSSGFPAPTPPCTLCTLSREERDGIWCYFICFPVCPRAFEFPHKHNLILVRQHCFLNYSCSVPSTNKYMWTTTKGAFSIIPCSYSLLMALLCLFVGLVMKLFSTPHELSTSLTPAAHLNTGPLCCPIAPLLLLCLSPGLL